MNIEDKLKYFNLKESFNEEDLNKAYQQKLAELNTNYELLKSRLKREDTISYREQTKEKINEIIWKIIFASNIDEEMDLAQRFGVMSIPTFISFNGGEIRGKQIGAVPKSALVDLVK